MSRHTEQDVRLIAHLTRDAVLRDVGKGREVLSLRVATNSYAGQGEKGEARYHTEYHDVVSFAKAGRFAALIDSDQLGKGAKIAARGEIRKRKRTVKELERLEVTIVCQPRDINVLVAKPMESERTALAADDLPPDDEDEPDI
ncbi:single-stranded DNA-binding protein [Natronocella acetinitrilica]|uniref:Single-stranded DNA-binding protein n=1 Tax=Natronocella acetinitrilica TaxID=414046 RepID=A0AAE3G4H3_9GAMM|nr:single-stranded DNA-binding protein [Natronocella acetinitrilica]MCP1674591.1 single-stranded DNA-binding protein [Natronocella acetinitrilica]